MATEGKAEKKTESGGSYVFAGLTMALMTGIAARLLFTEKRISELETDIDIVKTLLSGHVSGLPSQETHTPKQKTRSKEHTKEKHKEEEKMEEVVDSRKEEKSKQKSPLRTNEEDTAIEEMESRIEEVSDEEAPPMLLTSVSIDRNNITQDTHKET